MKRTLLAIVASACAVGAVHTATDGTLGATSTGSVTITATVPQPANPDGARITGLQDVTIANWDGSSLFTWPMSVCLYHKGPTASIRVTQTSGLATGSSRLRLAAPSGEGFPIIFRLKPQPDAQEVAFDDSGSSHLGTFNRVTQDCSSGARSDLRVNIPARENGLNGLPAGAYTGVFTVQIANE